MRLNGSMSISLMLVSSCCFGQQYYACGVNDAYGRMIPCDKTYANPQEQQAITNSYSGQQWNQPAQNQWNSPQNSRWENPTKQNSWSTPKQSSKDGYYTRGADGTMYFHPYSPPQPYIPPPPIGAIIGCQVLSFFVPYALPQGWVIKRIISSRKVKGDLREFLQAEICPH